jgi:hypothetical protein
MLAEQFPTRNLAGRRYPLRGYKAEARETDDQQPEQKR